MLDFLLPKIAYAQCTVDPGNPGRLCDPTGSGDFYNLLTRGLGGVFVILGFIVIGMVVYSGFRMITSQGNDEALSKAKSSLFWSLGGFILVLFAFIIVNAVFRFFQARNIDPNDPSGVSSPIASNNIMSLVVVLFNGALGVVGLVALLFIIINGFMYLTSRGNDEQLSKAKSGLTWSIIGLIVAAMAYVIVAAITNFVS